MLAPRLRQSMSYSLWFSISVFILDLSSCPRVSEGGGPDRPWILAGKPEAGNRMLLKRE